MKEKFKKHSPKKKKKDTKKLGEHIIENWDKGANEEVRAVDAVNQMHKDWEKNLLEAIENGKKAYDGDFFISILQKTERLFDNVNRLYWVPRVSCPTPTYDQTVYKYHAPQEMLEFIWTIPDRETAQAFRDNPLMVPEEEKELRQFVLDFYDGTLDRRCKLLNSEKDMQPQLIITKEETH